MFYARNGKLKLGAALVFFEDRYNCKAGLKTNTIAGRINKSEPTHATSERIGPSNGPIESG
jgi:hypothetical protein